MTTSGANTPDAGSPETPGTPAASTAASTAPDVIGRVRELVRPATQRAVADMTDARMRAVAGYQMGWQDADGNPSDAGGKAIRSALVVTACRAAGGRDEDAVPAAVAVELVHNFSLLHDDVMDRDETRRHRPTGWIVYGEGQAILAGNAMLIRALEVVRQAGPRAERLMRQLLASTQELIGGQSRDLDLEQRTDVSLDDVLQMEIGKTASLLACSTALGGISAGADDAAVAALASFGHELGVAFQLVDDILGVIGDPRVTGKSSSSDVRAGKRSAPIVAALNEGSGASRRLAELLADGPPSTEEDVALATKLVLEAGGVAWAGTEADLRLSRALAHVRTLPAGQAVEDLCRIAEYIVARDR